MPDEFERFLASSLAPPERLPDRWFVAAVQARVELEERFARQRRQLIGSFAVQLVALFAVSCGLFWFASSAPVDGWFAKFPTVGIGLVLIAFVPLIALFGRAPANSAVPLH
jgi:uncharacterized membrane protein YczE